jgi:hypothetical protein
VDEDAILVLFHKTVRIVGTLNTFADLARPTTLLTIIVGLFMAVQVGELIGLAGYSGQSTYLDLCFATIDESLNAVYKAAITVNQNSRQFVIASDRT